MAAGGWQEAAAQQAEQTAARVRDVLSGGLGLLRTELGLELGLDPQGLPTWLALALPAVLGLALLGLLLAAACGGGLRKKAARSAAERKGDEAVALTASGGPGRAAGPGPGLMKGDEQKKRNKKKLQEKAARVRGWGSGDQFALLLLDVGLGAVSPAGIACVWALWHGAASRARSGSEARERRVGSE